MQEGDNAVPKDLLLKHPNYEKIGRVPTLPTQTNTKTKLTQTPPYLRQPAGVLLGNTRGEGRENLERRWKSSILSLHSPKRTLKFYQQQMPCI